MKPLLVISVGNDFSRPGGTRLSKPREEDSDFNTARSIARERMRNETNERYARAFLAAL